MVDSGTVLHLPRIEYQLWCTWRYLNIPKLQLPHFLAALFSHSEPRLPPWIVQKMACEDAGKSEVGASIVLTDSCIGNKMVMRRHVRNS